MRQEFEERACARSSWRTPAALQRSGPGSETKDEGKPATGHRSLITLFLVLACAGCGTINPVINEGNYLTYDHPFTDAAAQAILQSAGKICAERKQNAIKTSSTCSLKQCTTHYQCVDKTKN